MFRVQHSEINGWFTVLNFFAWVYLIALVFIIQMQVFDQIHARFHVILLSYLIPYPAFVLAVGYQQRLKYFYLLALLWVAAAGLNFYFNYTFISVLLSCSDYEACNVDQVTYAWYGALFLMLSLLDLGILVIYIRVIPVIWNVDQYIQREDIIRYVRQLAYFTGQSHPHHLKDVHCNSGVRRRKQADDDVVIGNGLRSEQQSYDAIVHTTHHTLKSVTLRIPKHHVH